MKIRSGCHALVLTDSIALCYKITAFAERQSSGRSDGIGRRAGLKIPCPSGRVGSTPTFGTQSRFLSYGTGFFVITHICSTE